MKNLLCEQDDCLYCDMVNLMEGAMGGLDELVLLSHEDSCPESDPNGGDPRCGQDDCIHCYMARMAERMGKPREEP